MCLPKCKKCPGKRILNIKTCNCECPIKRYNSEKDRIKSCEAKNSNYWDSDTCTCHYKKECIEKHASCPKRFNQYSCECWPECKPEPTLVKSLKSKKTLTKAKPLCKYPLAWDPLSCQCKCREQYCSQNFEINKKTCRCNLTKKCQQIKATCPISFNSERCECRNCGIICSASQTVDYKSCSCIEKPPAPPCANKTQTCSS
jgi:hypothetical protein